MFLGLGFMGLVYLYLLIYHIINQPNGQKIDHTWILWMLKLSRCFFHKTLNQFMLGSVFEIFFSSRYVQHFVQSMKWLFFKLSSSYFMLDPPEPQQTLPLYFFRGVSLSWVCKLLRNGDIYHSLPQTRHWVSTHPLILQNHTKYLCGCEFGPWKAFHMNSLSTNGHPWVLSLEQAPPPLGWLSLTIGVNDHGL